MARRMDDQNRNLILATALSFLVILGWYLLFPPPDAPTAPQPAVTASQDAATPGTSGTVVPPAATAPTVGAPGATADVAAAAPAGTPAVPDAPRVLVATDRLVGSISLRGGRIDDLHLADYHVGLDPRSDTVRLLIPEGTPHAYFALFGWSPGPDLGAEQVPGPDTIWTAAPGAALSVGNDVVLTWENGQGQSFTRTISVDENYVFTVTDRVENTGATAVRMAPYGLIQRHGEPPDLKGFFVIHEGAVLEAGGVLEQLKYKKMRDLGAQQDWGQSAKVYDSDQSGWVGITDHYWMTSLIPPAGESFKAVVRYNQGNDIYQTISMLPTRELAPGAATEVSQRLFAGAKEWEVLRSYENAGVYRFVDSIDWGWYFFLTKPIFRALHFLHGLIGNMGWSIVILTFCIKALLFPLAYKSYVSMAKMKELQPQMEQIKERVGDDRAKLQSEMMALYKRERVNPAAGCLPILLQIPIFFSLYKVIFVTLELRHAAWIGWIRDLSAPDPSSLFNLWGLLPWAAPAHDTMLGLVFIGLMPLLLGISMWLQQKLNPAPADPTQAMIFAWMPWIFMFMLGKFASGLVLYWITNNTLTFLQQYTIMRSHGMKPDIFGNIRGSFRRKPPPETGVANKTAKPGNRPARPRK